MQYGYADLNNAVHFPWESQAGHRTLPLHPGQRWSHTVRGQVRLQPHERLCGEFLWELGSNKVMGALGREGWRGVRIKEEVVRVGCWLGWSEVIKFWEMGGWLGGRENICEGWEVNWEGERIFEKDGRLIGRERESLRRMGGWLGGREFSCSVMMMMMSWCLMSSDVSWHIRDKLWPMPKHGSVNLYVHGNQKAR